MSGTLPSAEEWAARCGLTRQGREWVGPCPSCGGTDRFHVTDREDTARWGCRGCIDNRQDGEKQAATRAVLEAAFPNREGRRAEAASRRPAPAAGSATGSAAAPGRGEPADERRRAYAARAWASAIPVPAEEGHPARRWLWGRGKPLPGAALWPPGEPLPGGVRWLPEFPADGWPYGGRPPRYGAVAVLLAPPRDWFAARPGLPDPAAVQACFVDPGGAPARAWGRESPNKLTLGVAAGAVSLIGLAEAGGELLVCEGLADALALAARHPSSTVCTALGTAGLAPGGPAAECAHGGGWSSVRIFTDLDWPGRKAGRRLRAELLAEGVPATQAPPFPDGHKDAAAWAEANPLTVGRGEAHRPPAPNPTTAPNRPSIPPADRPLVLDGMPRQNRD